MEQLLKYYQDKGYEIVSNDKYDEMALSPNFLFEKDSTIIAVVSRSSETVSKLIIQRFSTTKRISSKIIELYFLFPKKPSIQTLSECHLLGIGIFYLNNSGNIEIYAEPKPITGRKKIPSLPRKQMFFCSRQNLDERKEAETLINELNESLRAPIYPILVEKMPGYDIRMLWPLIEKWMDECDYVLIVLSGEYRKIIDQEARRAIDNNYEPEELLFYVKSDKATIEAYEPLLKYAHDNSVKFQEYFDVRSFKTLFNNRLMTIIKDLHEVNNVPFLETL